MSRATLGWPHLVAAGLLLAACSGVERGHPGAGGGGTGGASGGVGGTVDTGGGGANDGGAADGGASEAGGASTTSEPANEDDGGCSIGAAPRDLGSVLLLGAMVCMVTRRRRRTNMG